MKKLTVVIVSYNVRHYLVQCIDSVERAANDIDHEIYVVDNASADDTVSWLRQHFSDRIHLVESHRNLGFARANNIAIRQSESEYVLLLNPDTFISENTLHEVLTFMDAHPNAGGVGVMMHNADGSLARESRRGLPTPWVSMLKMLGFSRRYYMSHLPWDQPGRIDVISGAFCMLRRSALDKVGLLDEDFFMYGEDIDLSYRLLKGGFENWYVPATIMHYKGESTQKSSYRYVHVFYQAMLIFFRKHYSHLSLLVTLPVKLAIYFRAFIALVQMQYWRARISLGLEGKRHAETTYCFIGSDTVLDECRQLASRKGLTATYIPCPSEDESCDNLQIETSEGTCIVYDTSHYSYRQIIADMHGRADKHVATGTYNPATKTIIIPNEIIR